MTRIIAVINQKGGVGKTTTAVNLAHGLTLPLYDAWRVLLVDLDSQGSATLALGMEPGPDTQRLLVGGIPLKEAIWDTGREGLDLIRSDHTLAHVRDWLAGKAAMEPLAALSALRWELGRAERYGYVIIDCGPGLDILTLNAIMASTDVLLPIRADYLSAAGASQALETMDSLRRLGNASRLSWVVPTFYDARPRHMQDILSGIQRTFGAIVTPPIRANIALAEAAQEGQTIWEYAPRSHGAEDYARLVGLVRQHDQA